MSISKFTKLVSTANKLEKKLAQEMAHFPLQIGDLARRLNQLSAGAFKSIKPTGAAVTVVSKIVAGEPVTEAEKQAAVADVMNYGTENANLGFSEVDLQDAINLINHAKTANKQLNKLTKKIASYEKQFTKLANGVFKKVKNENGEKVKVPAIYQVCGQCHGTGQTVNSSVELDEVRKLAASDYLKTICAEKCPSCKGKRVIKALDSSRATAEEKKLYEAHQSKKNSK